MTATLTASRYARLNGVGHGEDGTGTVGAIGAAASLLAIGAVAVVVLRDIRAYGRPPTPPRPPRAVPAVPVVPVVPAVPVVQHPAAVADEGSMLGTLAATEADERPALRRVGSGLVLLAVTLGTAGLVGLLIYRGLAGLG
jgi:hypothetical protein